MHQESLRRLGTGLAGAEITSDVNMLSIDNYSS